MFRNKLGALAFVVLTMISAASLIGSEDSEGALLKAAADIERQREEVEEMRADLSSTDQPDSYPDEGTFFSDEELVDAASGLDPTPESEELDTAEPAVDGEIVLTESDAGITFE